MPSHPDDSAALAIQTPAINDRSLAAGLAYAMGGRVSGISFDAGTGPLEFKGQKLTLSSMTDYELHATGQLKLSGDAGVSVEGPTVSVTGQAETQVTSNGTLTLRGTMVAIN